MLLCLVGPCPGPVPAARLGPGPGRSHKRARPGRQVTCPSGSPAAVAHWQWHAGQLSSWPRGISSRLILEQNVTR